MRTVVHFGPYKTGSTYLQRAWWDFEKASSNDLCVSYRGTSVLRHNEAWCKQRGTYITYAQSRSLDALAATREHFESAFKRHLNCDILFITDESLCAGQLGGDISYRLAGPDAPPYPYLPSVCEALSYCHGEQTTFVAMIRSIPTFLESCYLNLLTDGSLLTFEEFKRRVRPESFRWSQVFDPVAEVVGRERLQIYPFEFLQADPLGFVERLSHDQGLPVPDATPSVKRPGMSGTAYRLYLERAEPLSQLDRRRLAIRLKNAHPKSPDDPPRLFTPVERDRLVALSKDDRKAIFERYVPPDLKQFFEPAY